MTTSWTAAAALTSGFGMNATATAGPPARLTSHARWVEVDPRPEP